MSAETVRVSTESLDRLLRSSRQLLTESLRQDEVTRDLAEMGRQIDDLEREWDSVRRLSASSLHRLRALPEFSRVMRHLDFVEREVRTISRKARRLRVLQRRNSWTLRSLGRGVQQDVQRARMIPAENVFQGFRKMVRDLARDHQVEVEFHLSGCDVAADRMVLQALKDPLMHMLRNCVIHGIEPSEERRRRGKPSVGRVALTVESMGNRLTVVVDDDGRGLDLRSVAETAVRQGLLTADAAAQEPPDELAQLIFRPRFSTSPTVTELSGRGMGLSVVAETIARLRGSVELRTRTEPGSCFVLTVPLTISTHRVLLVSCERQTLAIPLQGLARLMRFPLTATEMLEGRPVVIHEKRPVPLVSLAYLLGLKGPEIAAEAGMLNAAVLKSGGRSVAVAVDGFVAELEALIQDLTGPAAAVPHFAGAVLLGDGRVSLVIDPDALIARLTPDHRAAVVTAAEAPARTRTPCVLVVDDSFTTRTLEKSILEAHGFRVSVAVDGVEALSRLRAEEIDVVISDIQMPKMDGFALLEEIKRDYRLASIPVILVTSMSRPEDQQRGLSLGADAYIVKRKFDHQALLETIRQVL